MTTRTPDFLVVKRDGIDGVTEYLTHEVPEVYWSYDITVRTRFVTRADAERSIRNNPYKGPSISIVPVYCTTRKTNPMRERSTAWVLRRLAEGKAVVVGGGVSDSMYRWVNCYGAHGLQRHMDDGPQSQKAWRFVTHIISSRSDARVLCRIARPEEVPNG